MMTKVVKIFFSGLFLLLYTISFAQQVNSDDEIKERYILKFTETNLYKLQDTVSLVKVKPGYTRLIKQQFSNRVLLQINTDWFIINAADTLLQHQNFFIKIFPACNNYKLSVALLQDKSLNKNAAYNFIIKTSDSSLLANILEKYKESILYSYKANYFTVKTRLSFVVDTLINNSFILFAELAKTPKEEMVINDYDNSVNSINLFFSKFPLTTGEGLSASIKENLFDTADIDFKNRYQFTPNISSVTTTHATTMATLIGGGGNSFYTGKGVAWGSRLSSSDFANLLPDDKSLYQQYGISVQNHSYGTLIENFYGIDANAFDESLIDNPTLVYVFSAGNSGMLSATDGQYKSLNGFANITGNFKQAKNIITVGSIDSFYNIPAASSKGPAYDGRIKPELVAYGNDGSSGAAAITSGTILSVQSAYKKLHHDSLPQNTLVKAILINSADDVYNAGPDYYSGYGNVNTYKAVRDINNKDYFFGNSKQNSIDSFALTVPANIKNLKITLVWNDEPAQPNAFTALVNDLDLELKNKNSDTSWAPWVLNSKPDSNALVALPKRQRDSLNVVEQITLSQPGAGNYKIYVKGYNISTKAQAYCVVYEMEPADSFQFISPSANDHFIPAKKGIIRWDETYDDTTGNLQYSIDKGKSWQTINNNISLAAKYYKWQVPDTSAIALMRFIIGNNVYTSDTFDFSAQLSPKVILDCSDSALISWQKIAGIHQYKIWQLADKYLTPYAITTDTTITIRNSISPFIAVAPLFNNGRDGLMSYTFNYNTQGAGCFINNFLANVTIDNNADLFLSLGTITGVDSVQFQIFTHNTWQYVKSIQPITTLDVHYLYTGLINGINTFRSIVWVSGNQVISNTASIYYFITADFIPKPNPLPRGQNLNILSSTLVTGDLVMYDVAGRKLIQQHISSTENIVQTNWLAAGVYFLAIYDDNKKKVFTGKLVVQ